MALKKSITATSSFNEEVVFPNAYHRVETVNGGKNGLYTLVTSYKSLDDMFAITNKVYAFTPDLNGSNFIAQAYQYIKTLPEFAGAIDC